MHRAKMFMMVGAVVFLCRSNEAPCQSTPAAIRALDLSVFGMLTGTYTGLNGGRNLGVTAGADLAFHPIGSFVPAIELRGNYPFISGDVARLRAVVGGVQISHPFRRVNPYLDILYGRGSINYLNGGFPNPSGTYQYFHSPSNVLSPGIGLDYTLNRRVSIKADLQLQRYSVPVLESGRVYTKPLSLGVAYHFGIDGN